jgi:hypothetical protein
MTINGTNIAHFISSDKHVNAFIPIEGMMKHIRLQLQYFPDPGKVENPPIFDNVRSDQGLSKTHITQRAYIFRCRVPCNHT